MPIDKEYNIDGLINDYDKNVMFKKAKIQINVTIDKSGTTLSVGRGRYQYIVPFGKVLKDILRELEK